MRSGHTPGVFSSEWSLYCTVIVSLALHRSASTWIANNYNGVRPPGNRERLVDRKRFRLLRIVHAYPHGGQITTGDRGTRQDLKRRGDGCVLRRGVDLRSRVDE